MDIANTTDTKKARGRKGPLAQNVYKLNLLSNFHFKSKKKAYNLGAPTQARVPFARVPSCPGTDARVDRCPGRTDVRVGQLPGCQVARRPFTRVPNLVFAVSSPLISSFLNFQF